jgi:cobalt/nickel transport protein
MELMGCELNKREIIFGLLIALFLVLAISPFASCWPDGLERVAKNNGFIELGEGVPVFSAPFPDYIWPGIKNEKSATSAAGVTGTILVFAVTYLSVLLIRKAKP